MRQQNQIETLTRAYDDLSQKTLLYEENRELLALKTKKEKELQEEVRRRNTRALEKISVLSSVVQSSLLNPELYEEKECLSLLSDISSSATDLKDGLPRQTLCEATPLESLVEDVLIMLSHLGTLIYDRSFKREEIKGLKKELAGARHELLRLENQLVALEEEKASQEEKQRLVRSLRKYVVACRKRQLGQLDICIGLLKGVVTGQYDMEAEEIESTLETLSKLVMQLEGGEVTIHRIDTVAMETLMSRVTTLLSSDFKHNESQMILDPSLSGMTLNADEKAMEFFLYAFFKEMLGHLFTETVLILSRHSQKENTLCVTIHGTYMREHLSFLGDTIDLGFTRLSKKGLERMARRLGVTCETLLEGCELTFSENSSEEPTLKKNEVSHNVIPLFA